MMKPRSKLETDLARSQRSAKQVTRRGQIPVPKRLTEYEPGGEWSLVYAVVSRFSAEIGVCSFKAVSLVVLIFVLGYSADSARAETITKYLDKDYGGVSRATIAEAIEDARKHFASSKVAGDDTYVITIPAGKFDLTFSEAERASAQSRRGTIDISGIEPGSGGQLVISGAGMNRTSLTMDEHEVGIFGRSVYRVTFQDFEMTRAKYTVTQGIVVSVSPGEVVLDIQPGFPSPLDIYDHDVVGRKGPGRYLREFTNSKIDPEIMDDNRQVAWRDAVQIAGFPARWQFRLKKPRLIETYQVGDLIAVKSKHGSQAYWFHTGSDITFRRVLWTDVARGVFRDMDRITISDCKILRSPPIKGQTPALATPGGGPQIGQPDDPVTTGNLVEGLFAEGTGDDAIACFNCADTIIKDNDIVDSFARGILLFRSPYVQLMNNKLVRSPLLRRAEERDPRP